MKLSLLLFFTAFTFVIASRKSYDGYKIISFKAKSNTERNFLRFLEMEKNVDFLTPPTKINYESIAVLDPKEFIVIKDLVEKVGVTFDILNEDIGKDIKETFDRLDKKKAFDINDYNSLEDIDSYLSEQVNNCPSGANCEIEVIGNTYENRPIRLFKLTKPGSQRKIHWFDSAIHAREWLAPATTLKIFDRLMKQTQAEAIELLNEFDFYFVIILNPDGYKYSWDSQRLWRKNRSPNPNSSCVGTDLNRNNDFKFGNAGTSTNPCSDIYGGSSGGSELETKAVARTVEKYKSNIVSWNTVHTHGQMILHPFGYVDDNGFCARADDHDDLYRVAVAYANAVENTYGTSWRRGTSCEVIYPASGGTDDYVKVVGGIKYSFTPELRGGGFNPPKSQIEPSFQEMWNGIVAMIKEIKNVGK